jgi:hypothetical protein
MSPPPITTKGKSAFVPEESTKSNGTVKKVSGAKTLFFTLTEIIIEITAVVIAYQILSCKETAKQTA